MNRLIAATIFLIIVSALKAQTKEKSFFVGDVISDTTTFLDAHTPKSLTPLLNSDNKIEIRYISSPSFYNRTFLVLIYNEEWSAKYYYYKTGTDTLLFTDITNNINIDSVFSQLVSNNIFSLPDQNLLRTEKYEYFPDINEFVGSGMSVGDGICYYIEFKVGYYYRRYYYCNPDSFADFYPHVPELRNFANIVEIFNKWPKK